jgi:hypothetical protein
MKNVYLNTTIKKRECIPFNMLKTTIKIIKIRTNSCKNKTQTERRREDEMRNGEKRNHGGGGWVLYYNFIDGFTDGH